MRRLFLILAIVALTMAAPSGVAAAPPDNDLPDGAIALGPGIPQTFQQDTTEATVSTDDLGCGSGGLDQATVWYTFTPDATGDVLIDATGSSYWVGVNVFAGPPTGDNLWWCADGPFAAYLEAGTTYYLMFADIDEDAANGGTLHVVLDVPPPPIEVGVSIDRTGKLDRSGTVTISGSITCSRAVDWSDLSVSVSQAVGRFRIHGWGWLTSSCGPEPMPWLVTVSGDNGQFAGGRVTVTANAFACDAFSCGEAVADATVRLRR